MKVSKSNLWMDLARLQRLHNQLIADYDELEIEKLNMKKLKIMNINDKEGKQEAQEAKLLAMNRDTAGEQEQEEQGVW